jgi:hypothetical protein
MSLSVIRTLFPQPTPDQEMLIGPSCLVLTDGQRRSIKSINLNDYQLSPGNGQQAARRIACAVSSGQFKGALYGAGTGALAGAIISLQETEPSLTGTISKVVIGGGVGATAGYYAGGELGRHNGVNAIENSLEYHQWKNEKYQTEIFSPLSNFMDRDSLEAIERDLTCPITWDWMNHPIHANDSRVYEKEKILEWLDDWDKKYPPAKLEELSAEERTEALANRSPIKGAYIYRADLVERKDHYDQIFQNLKQNYNQKVTSQLAIYAKSLAHALPMPMTAEETLIVKFYSASQLDRTKISNKMRATVLGSDLPEDEIEAGQLLLAAAAKIPVLI